MKGCYAQALQVLLLQIWLEHNELINDSDTDVECLGPQLKLKVELREPVDQVCTHLLCDLTLVSYQELLGIEMFLLFNMKVLIYLWSILCNALWVPDVKQITHFEVSRQCLHPLFPTFLH